MYSEFLYPFYYLLTGQQHVLGIDNYEAQEKHDTECLQLLT